MERMFTKEKTNVCKGVGILFLLFHHMFRLERFLTEHNMKFYLIPQKNIPTIATSARVCVWIFAFLSAYGLTYKYRHFLKEKKTGFLSKQWLSLMKPFWFIYLIGLLAFGLSGQSIAQKYEGNWLLLFIDALGWGDFFHTPLLIGVFWYMCLAQMIVLLIPLTDRLLDVLSDYGYIALCAVVMVALQFLPANIKSIYGGDYLIYLSVILLGSKLARDDTMNRLASIKLTTFKRVVICAALLIGTVGMQIAKNDLSSIDQWRIGGLLHSLSAVAICMLFGVFITLPPLCKTLEFLGKYSGIMFIVHAMIYGWFPQIVYVSKFAILNYILLVGESLAVSLLISYLMKWTRYDVWIGRAYDWISQKRQHI